MHISKSTFCNIYVHLGDFLEFYTKINLSIEYINSPTIKRYKFRNEWNMNFPKCTKTKISLSKDRSTVDTSSVSIFGRKSLVNILSTWNLHIFSTSLITNFFRCYTRHKNIQLTTRVHLKNILQKPLARQSKLDFLVHDDVWE